MDTLLAFFIGIASTILGGLAVHAYQVHQGKKKEKKLAIENKIVGRKNLKIIDENFLYLYEPGKISIEKIINDFGPPLKKAKGKTDQGKKIRFYTYFFENAKVEFSAYKNSSEILSTTVFSQEHPDYPITCRSSFEDDEKKLGEAQITDVIVHDHIFFENYNTPRDSFAIIKARFFGYPTIKYLYFCYQIDGNYDSVNDTKGSIIKQVCITQLDELCPTFSMDDTFYN